MATILIVNFDTVSSGILAGMFRARHHAAIVVDSGRNNAEAMRRIVSADLIVVDMSSDSPEMWRLLEQIRHFRREHGPHPMLLCVSRAYRGPRFELEIEQKGGRLVYVL